MVNADITAELPAVTTGWNKWLVNKPENLQSPENTIPFHRSKGLISMDWVRSQQSLVHIFTCWLWDKIYEDLWQCWSLCPQNSGIQLKTSAALHDSDLQDLVHQTDLKPILWLIMDNTNSHFMDSGFLNEIQHHLQFFFVVLDSPFFLGDRVAKKFGR